MDAVKTRPYGGTYVNVPVMLHDNGAGGFDDFSGGGDETMSSDEEPSTPTAIPVNRAAVAAAAAAAPRTSELTVSFEGEVYVFPAVTRDKVQAVLLLLGGAETPSSIPTSEFLLQQNNKVVDDVSCHPTMSRRIASLVRFREKRKERCFDKKIRYTCRKEVAQKMHRRNGQFASVKGSYKPSDGNWNSGNDTPRQLSVSRSCQHCGVSESSTPAMRRGPAGPRTLCNACGLMWANKGMLRDLTKGGRHLQFDHSEAEITEIKPTATRPEISYLTQGEELPEHRTPEHTQPALVETGNSSLRPTETELMETAEGLPEDSGVGIENSAVNLDEQRTLVELANGSGTAFDIPTNFDEQVCGFSDSDHL